METWTIIVTGVGVVVLFIIFWCLVTLLISKFAWARLAKQFAATVSSPFGKCYGYVSVLFRPLTSYNNCVKVTLTDAGILLAVKPLFRVGHPPLLIPWQYVEGCAEKKIWWFSTLRIELNAADVGFDIILPPASKANIDGYLATRGL